MQARERNDLIISWLTISLAFTWVRENFFGQPEDFVTGFLIMLIAVGAGFIIHELAHRYTAIRFGAYAKYRAWTMGLIFAGIMAITTGFVFAAPGAVYIYGPHLNRRQNGLISLAGPGSNIILALIFMALSFILMPAEGFLQKLIGAGIQVNLFLAAFNLLPVYPLDGSKVFAWDPKIWAVVFIPVALTVLGVFNIFI